MDSILDKLENSIVSSSDVSSVFRLLCEYLMNHIESLDIKIHPLGFYAISLGSNNKNVNLRLHIWNGDLAPQNKNLMIHNHVFEMKSLVLAGKLTNVIYRIDKDIGRDIEFVPDQQLETVVKDKVLLEKIKREMTQIVQDPLRDFSQPSACNAADRSTSDFHAISNGDVMSFNCQMTTAGRFPINYTKTYVLIDQFIKDQCVTSLP